MAHEEQERFAHGRRYATWPLLFLSLSLDLWVTCPPHVLLTVLFNGHSLPGINKRFKISVILLGVHM